MADMRMQGPKLSRGQQLLQAAALQGASPSCNPGSVSSPPCGSAPVLHLHTPPGSYNSPVLRLSESLGRGDDNSNSPLFSAAVGVIRSPSRTHASRGAVRTLPASPQRAHRTGSTSLPYAPHLQPNPPASPGACSPRAPAAGTGHPAAPRSPVRTWSGGTGLTNQAMDDRHLPASSPLTGTHGHGNCPRRWQWRRHRVPGAACPSVARQPINTIVCGKDANNTPMLHGPVLVLVSHAGGEPCGHLSVCGCRKADCNPAHCMTYVQGLPLRWGRQLQPRCGRASTAPGRGSGAAGSAPLRRQRRRRLVRCAAHSWTSSWPLLRAAASRGRPSTAPACPCPTPLTSPPLHKSALRLPPILHATFLSLLDDSPELRLQWRFQRIGAARF